jgi:hypothetical protein
MHSPQSWESQDYLLTLRDLIERPEGRVTDHKLQGQHLTTLLFHTKAGLREAAARATWWAGGLLGVEIRGPKSRQRVEWD